MNVPARDFDEDGDEAARGIPNRPLACRTSLPTRRAARREPIAPEARALRPLPANESPRLPGTRRAAWPGFRARPSGAAWTGRTPDRALDGRSRAELPRSRPLRIAARRPGAS